MFRSKPNHCISLRRNMSCSSLCPIQLRTPQDYIAEQLTIVFNKELCYTWSIKKRANNVRLALGSSQNYELMMPNVLRCARPYTLGIFIVYLHRSMIAITKETIEIIVALCQVLGTATNPFSFFHIRTV